MFSSTFAAATLSSLGAVSAQADAVRIALGPSPDPKAAARLSFIEIAVTKHTAESRGEDRTSRPEAGRRTRRPEASHRTSRPVAGRGTNRPMAGNRTSRPVAGEAGPSARSRLAQGAGATPAEAARMSRRAAARIRREARIYDKTGPRIDRGPFPANTEFAASTGVKPEIARRHSFDEVLLVKVRRLSDDD